MNTATPFPWTEPNAAKTSETVFRSIFEHAPVAAARCNSEGVIVEMNLAFEHSVDPGPSDKRSLRVYDLVPPDHRGATESLLRELLNSTRDSIRMRGSELEPGMEARTWTAWRLPAFGREPAHALLIADPDGEIGPIEESLLQSQRWETVGRLAGGVVHDFNNLLTGVLLYCDLLLASLDASDRRRRYAEEIRSAIVQAADLVRQLLVFARPRASQVGTLCLNQIAQGMQDLLSHFIGENIMLELKLDPDLGLVKIDPAQVQQILINLILNARDALPTGGRIVLETRNSKFQSVPGSGESSSDRVAFPCVVLAVSDNGCGMDTDTREHVFDPFFTTKSAGQGTGLGLTTVRGIVTSNGGLIHFESEPGRGTRVMILLPRIIRSASADFSDISTPHSDNSLTAVQEIQKESLL
ncbi:MAG: ATP-binding protein [Candidatus Sulfotelmatobacter sp.]